MQKKQGDSNLWPCQKGEDGEGWFFPICAIFLLLILAISAGVMSHVKCILEEHAKALQKAEINLKALNLYIASLPDGEEKEAAKVQQMEVAEEGLKLMRSYRDRMRREGFKEGQPGTKEIPAPSSFTFIYSMLAIKHATDPE